LEAGIEAGWFVFDLESAGFFDVCPNAAHIGVEAGWLCVFCFFPPTPLSSALLNREVPNTPPVAVTPRVFVCPDHGWLYVANFFAYRRPLSIIASTEVRFLILKFDSFLEFSPHFWCFPLEFPHDFAFPCDSSTGPAVAGIAFP